MTILRQVAIALEGLALMAAVVLSDAPALLYPVAYCAGYAVSRYDEGATRR